MTVKRASARQKWAWREGAVDATGAHLKLLFGSQDADPHQWFAAARVGPPNAHVFRVEWLIDQEDPANREIVSRIREAWTSFC